MGRGGWQKTVHEPRIDGLSPAAVQRDDGRGCDAAFAYRATIMTRLQPLQWCQQQGGGTDSRERARTWSRNDAIAISPSFPAALPAPQPRLTR